MYHAGMDAPLPKIKIPLRQSDNDATLDLQAVIDQTYHNGAYDFIDYRAQPIPPLSGEFVEFADRVLRGAGKR